MSNLGAFSMWDLFRGEVESQMRVFTDGLLALETGGSSKDELASTMRAAHSIKGAARIVHLDVAVQLSHSMEDCLVAAQEGALVLHPAAIDVLLSCGDLLARLSKLEEAAVPIWVEEQRSTVDQLLAQLADVRAGKFAAPETPASAPASAEVASAKADAPPAPSEAESAPPPAAPPETATPAAPAAPGQPAAAPVTDPGRAERASTDRAIRVSSQRLNRLMDSPGNLWCRAAGSRRTTSPCSA